MLLAVAIFSGTTATSAATGLVTAPPTPTPEIHIAAELTERLTSLTAHVGDTFAFKTTHDEKFGDLDIPAGSIGHGRLAIVTPAHDRHNGALSLQADTITLPDGKTLWVNIDTTKPIRGHYANRHTHFTIVPLPIGIVPISRTRVEGNLILEPGTPFSVFTIAPRKELAPLLTAPPVASPAPNAPSPGSAASPKT